MDTTTDTTTKTDTNPEPRRRPLSAAVYDIQAMLADTAQDLSLILVAEHPDVDQGVSEGVDITERAVHAMNALQTAIQDLRHLEIDVSIGHVDGVIEPAPSAPKAKLTAVQATVIRHSAEDALEHHEHAGQKLDELYALARANGLDDDTVDLYGDAHLRLHKLRCELETIASQVKDEGGAS